MSNALAILDDRPAPKPRLRLEFLDGLRGLAALYIVLFHAFCHSIHGFPVWAIQIIQVAGDGKYAVGVFIVLSGFCLMLPVVRSRDVNLKGGFSGYMQRRMRRILPPYYAALVIGLIPIALSQLPKYLHGHADKIKNPMTAGDLISHLFLLHNLNAAWAGTIDGPMWSVSTEWEIYFLFALLLLPLWKWMGNTAAIVCGFAIGLLPYALPCATLFSQAYFWLAGLFAIGMASAAFCFSPKYSEVFRKSGQLAGAGALVAYAMLVILGICVKPYGEFLHVGVWTWIFHALVGFSTAGLIVYCCHQGGMLNSRPSPILAALQSSVAVALGTFSYSLYLTHEIVFNLCAWFTDRRHLTPQSTYFAIWLIEVPVALFLAYLFHLAFERPFLTTAAKPAAPPIREKEDNRAIAAAAP